MGIEPTSPAWKAGALAIVLHLHSLLLQLIYQLHEPGDHSTCADDNKDNMNRL